MDQQQAIKQLITQGTLPTPESIAALVGKVEVIRPSKGKVESKVEVIQNANYTPKKFKVSDFTTAYRNRYSTLRNLLFNRPQVSNAVSISHTKSNPDLGKATLIAMISSMSKSPTGSLHLTLEDLSGSIKAILSPKKEENTEIMSWLTLDEVVSLTGSVSKGIFFIDELTWPDIPMKPAVHSEEEVYAAFSGDIHSGSNMYLEKDFNKFVDWLCGKSGSEKQREIARRTKYVFFAGDIVDGIGIYPNQEKELTIDDIYKQYDSITQAISRIPSDKNIIVTAGNHDAVRIEEPQPKLSKTYAAPLYELPNVINLTNPSYVNIHKVGGQPGFETLLYHGYSFDRFVDKIEGLRLAGGYDRADLIHKFLLQRRHLSPTHDFNVTIPLDNDPLIITKVPDILASGHIHKASIGNYKNCLLFSGSCWQATTKFQEKVGHNPDPGMIPLLNLQTRKSTMLEFK